MDQIEFEKEVKECGDPRVLYKKGEYACYLYDKGQIPKQQWEESMDLVKDRLRAIADLKNQLNAVNNPSQDVANNRVEVKVVEGN